MTSSTPARQWLALNKIINCYRFICVLLSISLTLSTVTSVYIYLSPPLVISNLDGEVKRSFPMRKDHPPEPNEIKGFVKDFIEKYYKWTDEAFQKRLKNLRPIVTEEFLQSIEKNLKKSQKKFKGVSQYPANIQVAVSKKDVIAQFDRIVRLKGLPLISITQVSLQIIQKRPSRSNPMGLYINSLLESRYE